jgi:hypothetical protein
MLDDSRPLGGGPKALPEAAFRDARLLYIV